MHFQPYVRVQFAKIKASKINYHAFYNFQLRKPLRSAAAVNNFLSDLISHTEPAMSIMVQRSSVRSWPRTSECRAESQKWSRAPGYRAIQPSRQQQFGLIFCRLASCHTNKLAFFVNVQSNESSTLSPELTSWLWAADGMTGVEHSRKEFLQNGSPDCQHSIHRRLVLEKVWRVHRHHRNKVCRHHRNFYALTLRLTQKNWKKSICMLTRSMMHLFF